MQPPLAAERCLAAPPLPAARLRHSAAAGDCAQRVLHAVAISQLIKFNHLGSHAQLGEQALHLAAVCGGRRSRSSRGGGRQSGGGWLGERAQGSASRQASSGAVCARMPAPRAAHRGSRSWSRPSRRWQSSSRGSSPPGRRRPTPLPRFPPAALLPPPAAVPAAQPQAGGDGERGERQPALQRDLLHDGALRRHLPAPAPPPPPRFPRATLPASPPALH